MACCLLDFDVNEIVGEVAAYLVNNDDLGFDAVVTAVGQPSLIVHLVLESLHQQDLIQYAHYLGGDLHGRVLQPNPRRFSSPSIPVSIRFPRPTMKRSRMPVLVGDHPDGLKRPGSDTFVDAQPG